MEASSHHKHRIRDQTVGTPIDRKFHRGIPTGSIFRQETGNFFQQIYMYI